MRKSHLLALLTLSLLGLVLAGWLPARGDTATQAAGLEYSDTFFPLISLELGAQFVGSPTYGALPLTVQFTNMSSGGYTASFWDFGDGHSSTDIHPLHTYNAAGNFTVTLTITRHHSSASLVRQDYIRTHFGSQALRNPSFEDGWIDLSMIAQQPNEWTLDWLQPGETLYDDLYGNQAGAEPECVHKHNNQLPPDERLGMPGALILDGDYTYKIFHGSMPFGAQLTQTVSNLPPHANGRLVVPILVDRHEDTDPYGGESGVWVNGVGAWVPNGTMGDRTWYYHEVLFAVPAEGEVDVLIRVKDKYGHKDYFIDALIMQVTSIDAPSGPSIGEISNSPAEKVR